jgi:hypothetical protein
MAQDNVRAGAKRHDEEARERPDSKLFQARSVRGGIPLSWLSILSKLTQESRRAASNR